MTMKSELYANFMDNGQEKSTKFIISDEWAQVEEILKKDAVFSNPKYIKIEDVPKELPNLTRFLRDRSCMTVQVYDYDKTTKQVGNELAAMIILIQGTSNQTITMKKLSGGYSDQDFMTQLNPVLAKVG
jgi:hypothetical protein